MSPQTTPKSNLEKRIESLEKTLRGGNGDFGLVTSIAVIQNSIEEIQKDVDNLWQKQREETQFQQELAKNVVKISDQLENLKMQLDHLQLEQHSIKEQTPNFRWTVEKIFLPLLLPLVGSALGAIGVLQYLGGLK
jgi:septation ring formation regulator EzrA